MTTASIRIPNITERLQADLGIQQAQTISSRENVVGDSVGRLFGARGDLSRLQALWSDAAAPTLVEDWESKPNLAALESLRAMLDASFVVDRRSGKVRTVLPTGPAFVAEDKGGTLYRDIGRAVVEGLWGEDDELRAALKEQIRRWSKEHPLACLLSSLVQEKAVPVGASRLNLRELVAIDPALRARRDELLRADWRAWLAACQSWSADEQIETMGMLLGLHLHTITVQRLAVEPSGAPLPLACFVQVPSRHTEMSVQRAAGAFFAFWRDRAMSAIHRVAAAVVEEVAGKNPALEGALVGPWAGVRLWQTVELETRIKQGVEVYRRCLEEAIGDHAGRGKEPSRERAKELIVSALVRAFTPQSGVQAKVKDYLRQCGAFAGIVGPTAHRARKRYFLADATIDLLVRLHLQRPPNGVHSQEDERSSVEAFLDDVFHRYGLFFGVDRPCVQKVLFDEGLATRLARLLPPADAMSENRRNLERRLDVLRLLRRYSDASATLHVPR